MIIWFSLFAGANVRFSALNEGFRESCHNALKIGRITRLAFPDYEHVITTALKLSDFLTVVFYVPAKLGCPIRCVGSRLRSEATPFMRMPEAAVNEDCPLAGLVCEIRLAGKISEVLSEAKS